MKEWSKRLRGVFRHGSPRITMNGEKGFTLIELLLAIVILGVLAGIVVPYVTRFTTAGRTEAAKSELATVQTAVDHMMMFKRITEVKETAATNDMTAFPTDDPLYPNFIRLPYTKGTYSCLFSGLVHQESTGY